MPSALITGANRGLGFEFARQYLADGWNVYAACRDPEFRFLFLFLHPHGRFPKKKPELMRLRLGRSAANCGGRREGRYLQVTGMGRHGLQAA